MLRFTTAGESHGKALVAILDGVPAGLEVDIKEVNKDLARRMIGYGRGERMKIEKDAGEFVAGIRKGETIGSPVGILIENKDHKIDELPDVKCPRPGHADLAGVQKYNLKDARSALERASARESAARVAAGAIAKILLKEVGIHIFSHVDMIGGVVSQAGELAPSELASLAEKSDVRCADKKAEKAIHAKIDEASESGDTLGGSFEVIATGVPVGLGSYTQWDRRIDGALARAIISIPAVKAVSIGTGIENASKLGSEVHDAIGYDAKNKVYTRESNNAGGTEGGVTNGENLIVKGYMKPIATLGKPLDSVDIDTKKSDKASTERADVCAVPACSVIAEAMVALEIASALTDKFGGDSVDEIKRNLKAYRDHLKKA